MQLSNGKISIKLWTVTQAFLLAIALIPGLGCQQKCPVSQTGLTSFIGTDFRLTASNDPQFTNLSPTNFVIMNFGIGFSGYVDKVTNNQRSQSHALTFTFNVSPNNNLIKLQYSYPSDSSGGIGGGDPNGGGTTTTTGPVLTYQYSLSGTNFHLIDEGTGYTYDFTPFIGAVSPDQACTF